MRYFTSDLHFGHQNILKYGRDQSFNDLDHMRETIIHNWNSVVDPDDIVYVLGDVVMGIRADNLPAVERMNGYKILIAGNHDNMHKMYSHKANFLNNYELYGTYFYEMYNDLEMQLGDEKVLLCHFPAEGDHTAEERYTRYRPIYDGWIIHGHLHVEEINVAPKHIHIGIDADYTRYGIERFHPIPETAVIQAMEDFR